MGKHTARAGQGGRWRFGVFEFDAETLELRKGGRSVALRPQPLRILGELLARPGEVVSREELKQALWGEDTFVDFDQGLNHAVRELRAALGDVADAPRFIQTLQRRGYRLIGPVETVVSPAASLPATSPSTDTKGGPPGVSTAAVIPATSIRRRIWAVIIVAGILAAAGAVYLGVRSSEARTAPPSELVVRPFTSPADPALGAGIAHAITARLGSQQSVAVRSDPRAARVDAHTLEGDLSTHGNEVTAFVRLKAAGSTVWSEQVKVRDDELFSLEDVIAERVVDKLRLRLAAAEQDRMRIRYTSNSEAYADYLRGRAALVQYTREGALGAVVAFERALAHDPEYALARAGLAMASADMYLRFAPPQDVERWGERADAEARAALESNPDLAEAHLARAAVARKREFDWNATLSSARRALALNPNLDQARFFIAAAYYHNGFMEEARIEMERGRTLHGLDQIEPLRTDALIALFSGGFAAARGRLEEVSRLTSQPIGDTYLALAYYYTGSTDRARSMLETLARSESASTATRAGAALAGVLAAEGKAAEARSQLERVLARAYRDHHVAYSLGAAHGQLGEFEAATRWLRTAADTGFACPPFYERDPLLEPLRRREDFAQLSEYLRTRRDIALSGTSP